MTDLTKAFSMPTNLQGANGEGGNTWDYQSNASGPFINTAQNQQPIFGGNKKTRRRRKGGCSCRSLKGGKNRKRNKSKSNKNKKQKNK